MSNLNRNSLNNVYIISSRLVIRMQMISIMRSLVDPILNSPN